MFLKQPDDGKEAESLSLVLVRHPEPHLVQGDQVWPLKINRSVRAKRMKLKIEASGVVVLVLPGRTSVRAGLAFVERECNWIGDKLAGLDKPVPFAPGTIIPILGADHEICHVPERRGFVWREDAKLFVTGGHEHLPRRVRDWAYREIKEIISGKAEFYADKADTSIGRITIRDQKSRWGSCSSAGNLNFSWRLIFMPEPVIDYVVAHEVSHLRYMNHSVEFWDLVGKIYPDAHKSKQWLQKNGIIMHKYGATN